MTVFELISMLSAYPADTRVTLLDPGRRWLLPIVLTALSADGTNRKIDFIAITADSASDEIGGLVRREEESLSARLPALDNSAQPSKTRSAS
jgi:hypothetical protein